MDCIFCKIAQGQLPIDIIYQDETVVAFPDIKPQAPHHILIIPHQHIATLNELQSDNHAIIGHMAYTAAQIAKKLQLADNGYRVIMNCNADGGQSVYHIHMHLLGGRSLTWPPG